MSGSTPAAAKPQLSAQAPRVLSAWERSTARITIDNVTAAPILPVVVKLESAQGSLETWGARGRIVRWSRPVRGRKAGRGWEVLVGGPPPLQQAGARSAVAQKADVAMVELDPVWPGQSVALEQPFDAAYQHGDRLEATLIYIVLDPAKRSLCSVASIPTAESLVPCRPLAGWTPKPAALYLRAEDLDQDQETVSATASFTVRHPAFDIADARARAGVPQGPFGLDVRANRWVLFDPTRTRTLVVAPAGPVEELAGRWLELFMTLNAATETTMQLRLASAAAAGRFQAELAGVGVAAQPFTHKSHRDTSALLITVDHAHLTTLAQKMRAAGLVPP